jgi:hypothetical protein
VISPADLAAIRAAASAAASTRQTAALAAKDFEIVQLRTFIRYGLTEADSIDLNTGAIVRAEATPPAADEPTNP